MMPFVSQSQARFMFARHPKLAREFADKTRSIASLPQKVDGGRRRKRPATPKIT